MRRAAHLQVYPVDGSGAVVATGLDATISLQLPETSGTAERRPRTSTLSLNLNANVGGRRRPRRSTASIPTSYNQSTATTVYDASGNALTMTNYFKRATTADRHARPTSTWNVYSFVGDQQLTDRRRDRARR